MNRYNLIYKNVKDFYDKCLRVLDQLPADEACQDFVDSVVYEMYDIGLIASEEDLQMVVRATRKILEYEWQSPNLDEYILSVNHMQSKLTAKKQVKENHGWVEKITEPPKVEANSQKSKDPNLKTKKSIRGSIVSQILLEE